MLKKVIHSVILAFEAVEFYSLIAIALVSLFK